MRQLISVLGSLAMLCWAAGGLAWALGSLSLAKRCLAFGAALMAASEILILHGADLALRLKSHGAAVALLAFGAVALLALGRAGGGGPPKPPPKLAGKRRMERAP